MTVADNSLLDEIAALQTLSFAELRARYLEVFGEETASRNKVYLRKRIAYRLQERKYGGLSPRARARAELLAKDAPVRRRLPAGTFPSPPTSPRTRDARLPPPGTELRRSFNGTEYVITVLDDGFLFQGKRYGSLSVIARDITGTRWNGYGFFGLLRKEAA